ncbi:MAG: HEAT repeat domain-containing protein, partial [Planctomycetota bacterium]|jgi:HEAT repeat protein
VATRTLYGGIKVPAEGQSLLFLRREGEGWRPLAGQLGVWDISGSQGGATLALVRSASAAVRTGDRPQDLAAARRALVTGIAEATPHARAGAAMDLWMRPDIAKDLNEEQTGTLLATFATLSNRERTKAHLARVLGRAKLAAAGPAFVAAIAGTRGEVIASAAGEGLGLLGDDKSIRSLASLAGTQDLRMRLRIAGALSATKHEAARPTLEGMLADGEPGIRAQAAVGLGHMRTADAAPALLRRFEGERAESDARVRRALVWALAQCDESDAWAALKRTAANDTDEGLRDFARATLKNPRRGFRL